MRCILVRAHRILGPVVCLGSGARVMNSIIESCTVRVTPARVGIYWVNQYSHADLEMLELAVNRAMDRIPKEYDPVSSCPRFIMGEWHSSVSYLNEVKLNVQNG